MKTISLVYVKNTNLQGDEIICDTAKYLLQNFAEKNNIDIEIKEFGLLPPPEYFKPLHRQERNIRRILQCFEYKFINGFLEDKIYYPFIKNLVFSILILYWIIFSNKSSYLKSYYKEIVEDSDIVFFAGGGIFQQFYMKMWAGILNIVNLCSRKNIPIYFNAIGIEKSQILVENLLYKYILNKSVVKTITMREKFAYTKNLLFNKNKCFDVLDSGLWSSECYSVKKINSDLIGIGVIRPNIFRDMGWNINEEDVLTLYIRIIKELDKQNYNWELFANGNNEDNADYKFGKKILEVLNLPSEKLALYPKTQKDLLNIVKRYKAIIAARLHSNIVASSLGIPNVGLVWNVKLLDFAQKMGFDWEYIKPEKFEDSEYIISQLKMAIENGIDIKHLNKMKIETIEILETNLLKLLS